MRYWFQPDMKLRATALWLAVVLLLPMTAWGQTGAPRLSKQNSERAAQVLATWLECEDCQSGELKAVTRYGQAIVPSLAAVLEAGPSPATGELLRRELEARYDKLAEFAQKNPNAKVASTKEEFVAMYLRNFDAQHRARAAQALGAIGGTQARAALEAAAGKAERDDVRTTVRQSLEKMKK
jgi:hypothetical protein